MLGVGGRVGAGVVLSIREGARNFLALVLFANA